MFLFAHTVPAGVIGYITTAEGAVAECEKGYLINTQDKSICDDIDECSSDKHNCDVTSRATCTNTPGNFTCACLSDYEGDGTSGSCIGRSSLHGVLLIKMPGPSLDVRI